MYKLLSLYLSVLVILALLVSCREKTEYDAPHQPFPVSEEGTTDTSLTIYSNIMDTLVHYSVYLPPGYDTTETDYPVLYLLHGMGNDHRDWIKHGMANVMDYAFESGTAQPMVVIMPQGFTTFYCNVLGLAYEDFFIDEFLPYIEIHYRIKTERNNTAIAGLSMGGYGCSYHAFKQQDIFGSSYAMSAAFPDVSYIPNIRDVIDGKTSEELDDLPAYTMEVGNQDFIVIDVNVSFHTYLNSKDIEHSFIRRTGTHDWDFWMSCLPKAVAFVSDYFD